MQKGIPIGNLTSQLFANVYMNEFDQFVKHVLKIKYYARYTDDFVIISNDKTLLTQSIPHIQTFLLARLTLSLHPHKVSIHPSHRGCDFLGQIIFPHHRLLRVTTKKRIFKKLRRRIEHYKMGYMTRESIQQSLRSYLGLLSHVHAHKISEELKNHFWFSMMD